MGRRLRVPMLMVLMAVAVLATTVMADATTWSHTATGARHDAQLQTLFKGDAGSGPGGNVACDTRFQKKIDAEHIRVGQVISLKDTEGHAIGQVKVTRFDGKSLDWKIVTVHVVDAMQVIVKGGPAANIYTYPDSRANYGWDLHAPVNPNNGKYYGISNVSFCFGAKAGKAI